MPEVNRQWRVARLVEPGELIGPEHFAWHEAPLPEPADGEVLVRTLCLSTSPAQRGYVSLNRNRQLLPDVAVGAVMRGRGIGVVVASRHPDFAPGELYDASLGWQDYSIQRPRAPESIFSLRRVTDPVRPLTTELGVLGNAGMTAYFGLLEVGQFRGGESLLVSAAAGGVGSVAGQLARIRGASQVIGIAGSDDKCRWLVEELGFSAAVNYRTEDLGTRLAELAPRGFDVFFDNVGGRILDTGLAHLAMRARVVVCGWISVDYAGGAATGPANYRQLLYKRARIEGFVVFDYWKRYPEAQRVLKQWYRDGQLRDCGHVLEGLERMPLALQGLFTGANRGITACRVAPDP
ncbi:MAG: NADP-dependent oxidoreductase [Steroidobacteraceae bacterium]|nr:NADP-dependent oxidoreductase [Steroidobacteraceae bacterium]